MAVRPPSLSVVIPAFNEASRLPPTLHSALTTLLSLPRESELLLVDDGSTDGTSDAVRARGLGKRLRLIRSPKNRGKGAALAAGVRASRGERILLMDADGATPLSSLPLLEASLDAVGAGVVVGDRSAVFSSRPWRRRVLGSVFRGVAQLARSPRVEDTQCGFKLLTRQAATDCFDRIHLSGWAYDVELLFLANQLGYKVGYAEVPWSDMPGSKIQWSTPFEMLLDVISVALLYRCGIWRVQPSGDEMSPPPLNTEEYVEELPSSLSE